MMSKNEFMRPIIINLRFFFSKYLGTDVQLDLREFREAFRGIDDNIQRQFFNDNPANRGAEMFASDLLVNLFASIDINHDGFISYQEAVNKFKQFNQQMGRYYNENDVNNFFAKLDLNRDGRISLQEFRDGFKRIL